MTTTVRVAPPTAPSTSRPDPAGASTVDRLSAARAVLRPPLATTAMTVLLLVTLALSGVFVGDWFWVFRHRDGSLPPPAWFVVPALVVVVGTAVVALAAPAWLEYRHRLVPVPLQVGSAAMARVACLSRAAGLAVPPRLMWNPDEPGAAARAYGRPGSYRLQLAPAVLEAARRRPERVDMTLRHELAHLRHRDVLPSYAAVAAPWALLPVLLAPLLWRVADHDLSLVPGYLTRAAALLALAFLLRTALLRTREHDADIRAALWSPSADDYGRALGAARAAHTVAGLGVLRWHPTPAQRAAAVTGPERRARLRSLDIAVVGLLAGASTPLLQDLLVSADVSTLGADRAAWALTLGGTAVFMATSVLRASAAGALRRRDVALSAGSLVAAVSIGMLFSLNATGLHLYQVEQDVVQGFAVAVVAGLAPAVVLADVLRRPPHRRTMPVHVGAIVTAAGLAAATAWAVAPAAVLVGARRHAALHMDLPLVFAGGAAPTLAAVGFVSLAVLGLAAAGRWSDTGRAIVVGVAGGVIATVWMVLLRARSPLDTDERAWHFYLTCLWLGVLAAALAGAVALAGSRARLASAVVAAAAGLVVAALGLVVAVDAYGGSMGAAEFATNLRLMSGTALALDLPLLALVRLALPARAARTSRRRPARNVR